MLKWLRLSWRDRGRALEALLLILAARVLLLAVPFRRTVALTAFLGERLPARDAGDAAQLARLSYLVQRISAWIPGATCLTQALALKWMLLRRRTACRLRIGVAKEGGGAFKAHAWLETLSNQVLIGGRESQQAYTPLKFDLEKSA